MATYLSLPSGSAWTWATFVRTRSGGLVTAQAHPAASGSGSRLSVSVWTDADPPEAGAEVEIEASGVGHANDLRVFSLGEARDGTLELFYLYGLTTLYRRESRDGGATWSSREAVPVTLTTPGPEWNPYFDLGLDSIGHSYTRDGMTCLSILQGFTSFGNRLGVNSWHAGERDASGTYAWSPTVFPPARPDPLVATGVYTGAPLQLLRTGDFSIRGRPFRATRCKADGTATYVIDSAVTTGEPDWWTDERTGMRLVVRVQVQSSTQHWLQWRTRRLDTAGALWENVATAQANASAPTPVPLSTGAPVLNVQRRGDGVWEVLHADNNQRLRFARCRSLPMASTAANTTWQVD
ncbi:MAG: hypothetical protein ACK47B_11015 [Armatimonadota bacterium]